MDLRYRSQAENPGGSVPGRQPCAVALCEFYFAAIFLTCGELSHRCVTFLQK